MNIKELAEQAGLSEWRYEYAEKEFDHFAELIRQDEREQISHTYLKLTLEAVLRERESCSNLIANMISGIEGVRYAEAIRARSKHE